MPKGIISSFNQFEKAVEGKVELEKNPERSEALKRYFSLGNFVRFFPSGNSWPKLIYPSKFKIEAELRELRKEKELFSRKHGDWKQKYLQAVTYDLTNKAKKFKSKVYWNHVLKFMKDKDYREETRRVKLPTHLVADPKWEPMIRMFVTDSDYRKQLIETLDHSIVYKKDKELAKYAAFLQEFRREVSEKKMSEIKSRIDRINADIKMYNVLLKWNERLI